MGGNERTPRQQEESKMVDILHRVGIQSSTPDETYNALSTREGLAAWWTNGTQGESRVGGVLQSRFKAGGFDMKVLELDPGKRVLWQVVEGPEEWIGTKVSFDRPTSRSTTGTRTWGLRLTCGN